MSIFNAKLDKDTEDYNEEMSEISMYDNFVLFFKIQISLLKFLLLSSLYVRGYFMLKTAFYMFQKKLPSIPLPRREQ